MAWFKKTRKPMGSASADKPSRVPEGLWVKCPDCAQVLYNKDLEKNLHVCPKCAHHFRLSAGDRLRALFDGEWAEHFPDLTSNDPLHFTDTKALRRPTALDNRGHRRQRIRSSSRQGTSMALLWWWPPWSTHLSAAAWVSSRGKRSRAPLKWRLIAASRSSSSPARAARA